MVEAITPIGRALGVKTIAERVETAQVLGCLADIGVEYPQAIYIAAPQSVESLSRITRTHPRLKLVHSAWESVANTRRGASTTCTAASADSPPANPPTVPGARV